MGKDFVGLEDFGIEASGLLKLVDGVRLVACPVECKAGEKVELSGGGIALEGGLEGVNGAAEPVAACEPTT